MEMPKNEWLLNAIICHICDTAGVKEKANGFFGLGIDAKTYANVGDT